MPTDIEHSVLFDAGPNDDPFGVLDRPLALGRRSAPPTTQMAEPTDKNQAAEQFRCDRLRAELPGRTCALRWRASMGVCAGCAFGQVRARLLGLAMKAPPPKPEKRRIPPQAERVFRALKQAKGSLSRTAIKKKIGGQFSTVRTGLRWLEQHQIVEAEPEDGKRWASYRLLQGGAQRMAGLRESMLMERQADD